MSGDLKNTLALNHNPFNQLLQPDVRNNINKEILNILLGLSSPNKFQNMSQDKLTQLQKDIHGLLELKKISLASESVGPKICSECKEFFTKPLSCGCFLCSHLSKVLESQIRDFLGFSAEESIQQYFQIVCPKCNSELNDSDIERLFPEYRSKKDEIRLLKIQQSVQSTKNFICETCNNIRGIDCLPDRNILYCWHMCTICICKRYLENRNTCCEKCDARVDINAMAAETRNCHFCKALQYFLGDRMMESSPGHLLCISCMLDSVNKGYCIITNRIYTFQEKREYFQYIYVQCHKCGTDIFHNMVKKLSCCSKIYCEECTEHGVCPHCRVPARFD